MNISSRAHRYHPLLIAFCVLSVMKFSVRGPIRAVSNSGDFRAIYLAARAWSRGLDCYDPESIRGMWTEVGGPEAPPLPQLETRALYPPTTYALVSPLARLPWRIAKAIWCGLNVIALLGMGLCLADIAGVHWRDSRGLLLIAILFALEPSSTAVMLGQAAIITAALVAASLLSALRGADASGGLLEGLALALKPQLAAAVAAAFVLDRRWRACIAGALAFALLLGVAILQIHSNPHWINHYIAAIKSAFGPGGANDFFSRNPNVVELINLRYPLTILINNNQTALFCSEAIVIALAIPPALWLIQRRAGASFLHCVSVLILVELLGSYHRGYDAIMIAIPVAWSMSEATPRKWAWPIWIGAAMFMLPSGVGMRAIGEMRWFPSGLSSGMVWNAFIVPYQAWTLLIMALWMDSCLFRSGDQLGQKSVLNA